MSKNSGQNKGARGLLEAPEQERQSLILPEKPIIISFGGPSGVGKDTGIRIILKRFPKLQYLPRYTTKEPEWRYEVDEEGNRRRWKEKEGDYFFRSLGTFKRLERKGIIIGADEFNKAWYGANHKKAQVHLDRGESIIGAFGSCTFALQEKFPGRVFSIYIFADTPSLLRRIRSDRRNKGNSHIERMRLAIRDFTDEGLRFDRVVLNNDGRSIDDVVDEIVDYVVARAARMGFRVAGLQP